MSPDRKLDWFRTHGYTPEEVNHVHALVKARYTTDYVPQASAAASCSLPSSPPPSSSPLSLDGFTSSVSYLGFL
jgi:hypothetical protein